ncbi:MAG: tetratricopeptide repeat protein [Candidatus Omnitrophica bacterium]|nr:tetratricopeptide repeat protein [Candidatus Omnitrophota bacterium]
MTKTTFKQKIGLFFFAIGVTLLLLEVGLRFGGWLFLTLQENANLKSIEPGREYRIICLGESTTALGGANSYPSQLERILNSRQNQIKFKVINKGVPATTTDQIVARLENYFNDYHPQMIVAMMGINDPQDPAQRNWRESFSRYSKAFKLFDMIVRHLTAKKSNQSDDFLRKQIAKLEKRVESNLASRIKIELMKANLYRSANHPQEEKDSIMKVLKMDSQNASAWFLLGIYYQRQAEHQKALESFQKSYVFNSTPEKIRALEHIAQCFKLLNDDNSAEKIYRDILTYLPMYPEANGALGGILLEKKNYVEAIKYLSKQRDIDPKFKDLYVQLAYCYRRIGQNEMADKVFSEGVKIIADDPQIYYEWGYALMEDKKYSQAQSAFEEAIRLNREDLHSVNDRMYDQLLKCYEAQGKADKVAEIKKIIQERSEYYNPQTQKNYLKLVKFARQRRIPLVAVQYPYRPLAPLVGMLSSEIGIAFVDNQKIFVDALTRNRYDDLFSDRFAGDFGHCTPSGNALLANNVADQILEMVLKIK